MESDAAMAEKKDKDEAADSGLSRLSEKVAEKAHIIKYLIVAIVVILVVSGAVFAYLSRQRLAQDTAAESTLFRDQADAAANPGKSGLEAFTKDADAFKGLPAGARARIYAYGSAHQARNLDAAEKEARAFLTEYPQNPFVPRMRLALAQTLMAKGKLPEAVGMFRELKSSGKVDVEAESSLALAQALEREADAAKDNPDEYTRRLESARAAYNDIVLLARAPNPTMRWPQHVLGVAEFSLVIINDKLAGYRHEAPVKAAPAAPVGPMMDESLIPPPPSEKEKTEAEAPPAGEPAPEAGAGQPQPAEEATSK